ncbi:MAG: PEPxxWA-CTERM sorting domain-containing protein [Methylobacteriaceae bacterium]|nr:PEPxxWA-CTERM sorting domain-containing protein [Methylobacteriaceae bacterium]
MSTGAGLLPSEVRHLGVTFDILTDQGGGVLTLADAGSGATAWVTITSSTPFSSIAFAERAGGDGIYDQYFGNIQTGVPEPSTWAMMLVGFAGLASAVRRRRRAAEAAGV